MTNIQKAMAILGGPTKAAVILHVTPQAVCFWRDGKRRLPAEHCPAIERATHGAVRCESLRPDVDWAYLRGTHPNPTDGLPPEVAETQKEAA